MIPTDPSDSPATGKPLYRLGGCLLLLLLALALGALISTWMVISGGLPTSPLTLPPLEEEAEPGSWMQLWRSCDGELELTPARWNQLIAALIETKIADGELLAGSGMRLIPQPDGPLHLFLTLGFSEDLETVPWLLRGRFANLEIVGTVKIVSGSVAEAQLDLYQWGSIYKGENLSQEKSREIITDLLEELVPIIGEIRHLEYDGKELRFSAAK